MLQNLTNTGSILQINHQSSLKNLGLYTKRLPMDPIIEKTSSKKTLITGFGRNLMRVFLLLLMQEVKLPLRVINTGRNLPDQLPLHYQPSLVALLRKSKRRPGFQQSSRVLLKRKITSTLIKTTDTGLTLTTQLQLVCMMTKLFIPNLVKLVNSLKAKKLKRPRTLNP